MSNFRLRGQPLFRPDCHRRRNGRCNFLNGPFVFAAGNNREAVSRSVAPSGAKTLRVKLPGAGAFAAGLLNRLARYLAVRRKSHFEFSSGRAHGRKRLPGEESGPDLRRRHRLGS